MTHEETKNAIAALNPPASSRTPKQAKTVTRYYSEGGRPHAIVATVRWDDRCGNGHNSFSVTAALYGPDRIRGEGTIATPTGKTLWCCGGGCCHDEIAKYVPEWAHLIRWHLFDPSGPMHYVANTAYHALQHGPNMAWVYHKAMTVTPPGGGHPIKLREQCLKYCDITEAEAIIASNPEIYFMKIDEKTAKTRNLAHARATAVWPDATDEDMTAPGLEQRLIARLPALVEAMRQDVINIGFNW